MVTASWIFVRLNRETCGGAVNNEGLMFGTLLVDSAGPRRHLLPPSCRRTGQQTTCVRRASPLNRPAVGRPGGVVDCAGTANRAGAVCGRGGFGRRGYHEARTLGCRDGTKKPVGLWDGSTESKTVVRALLADLVSRRPAYDDGLLVVCDGAKALPAAVREVFGDKALIQRCTLHKRRIMSPTICLTRRRCGWMPSWSRLLSSRSRAGAVQRQTSRRTTG